MKREEFEHAIRAVGSILGTSDLLVIGSQALHASIDGELPEAALRSVAALAAALSGTLRGLLFEVEPIDPSTFVTAVAIICGAALVGCVLPALRAATVNPVTAIGDAARQR